MARKAKEILKARGYTDADFESMPMLNDARFCKALEDEDVENERIRTEHGQFKTDLDATAKWYQETAQPTINKLTRENIEAKAEAAKERARVQALEELGLFKRADEMNGGKKKDDVVVPPNQNNNDPDPRYVSNDHLSEVAERFGSAVATVTDLAEDHRELFGARLPGGATQLRKDYQDAVKNNRFGGDIRAFWEQKYGVQAKRTEFETRRTQEREDAIRKDERTKVMSESANPLTRTPFASRSPFLAKAAKTVENGTVDGKQPWEKGATVEQRRGERVTRFVNKVIEKTA